ncbi:hypothetical protein LBMAG15_05840 [Actinomycetes bacterium]|nr:hypothetical protein LBMAG15_05840 [Actinomycetes bacterium]
MGSQPAKHRRRHARLVAPLLIVPPILCWIVLLAGGIALAADTPTEPPPCGNTGQPCQGDNPVAPVPGVSGNPPEGPPPVGDNNTGTNNTGGDAPTVNISDVSLVLGQAVNVPINFVGGDGNQSTNVEIVVTVTGGTASIPGGSSGSTATIRGPFESIKGNLTQTMITAAQEGAVTISVRGYEVGKPNEAVTASRDLAAVGAPTPTPSPTPTPTPTPTEVVAPAPSAAADIPAATAAAPAIQTRAAIDLPKYEAIDEPKVVVGTTVAAVAVIAVVGVSAGAMAGGAGGAPAGGGSSSGSGGGSSGGPSSSAARRAEAADREDASHYATERASTSLAGIDVSFAGVAAVVGTQGIGDRSKTWRLPLTPDVDRGARHSILALARFSPLSARFIADGTYLRAMFGSGALLLPILAVVLGVLGVVNVNGLALAPSVVLLSVIAFIGTLDAFAGLAAFVVFTAGIAVSGGITGVDSIRTLLGLAVIGFGPALIAGAARPLRRAGHEFDLWERLTDFVIIPLLGAFTVQSMVSALSGLSGYEMPITQYADLIALIALLGLLLRVSLEELAARAYPARITEIAPDEIPKPGTIQRSIVSVVRTGIFLFIAVAFIGNVWQLWVGALIFLAAQLCEVFAARMPNNPKLFHAVPVGIPKLVLILLVSLGLSTLLTLVLGANADLARYSFVFLMLPGLALAALGMFGREPTEGDTRWYLRPSMRTWYRAGGILLLVAAIYITQML